MSTHKPIEEDPYQSEDYQLFMAEATKTCDAEDAPCDSCLAGGVCDGPPRLDPIWDSGLDDDDLPDYVGDLNAMHDALATLDDWKEGGDFENHLFRVLIRNKRARGVGHEGISTFDKIRACTADLAESFLLTKNLWAPTGEENE